MDAPPNRFFPSSSPTNARRFLSRHQWRPPLAFPLPRCLSLPYKVDNPLLLAVVHLTSQPPPAAARKTAARRCNFVLAVVSIRQVQASPPPASAPTSSLQPPPPNPRLGFAFDPCTLATSLLVVCCPHPCCTLPSPNSTSRRHSQAPPESSLAEVPRRWCAAPSFHSARASCTVDVLPSQHRYTPRTTMTGAIPCCSLSLPE
jgi:hypothetical protein